MCALQIRNETSMFILLDLVDELDEMRERGDGFRRSSEVVKVVKDDVRPVAALGCWVMVVVAVVVGNKIEGVMPCEKTVRL